MGRILLIFFVYKDQENMQYNLELKWMDGNSTLIIESCMFDVYLYKSDV